MKNLLAITLVFILSLFVAEESRGDIPNVTLKCHMNLENSKNNTRKINSERILGFGLNKYFMSVSIIRISNEPDIKSEIVRFNDLNLSEKFDVSPIYPHEIEVVESSDKLTLILKEYYNGKEKGIHSLHRPTLTLKQTIEDYSYYTVCKILDYNEGLLEKHIEDVIDHYYKVSSLKRN
jgi:hypothetical protein